MGEAEGSIGRYALKRLQSTQMDTPSVSIIPVNTLCLLILRRLKLKIFFQYVSRFSPENSSLLALNSGLIYFMMP